MCKTDLPHHLNLKTAGQEKLTDVSITKTPSASSSRYGEYRCETFRSNSGTRESTGGSSHPVGGMAGSLASIRYHLPQTFRGTNSIVGGEFSPRFIRLATPLIDITVSRVPRVRGDQLRGKTEQATKRDDEYYMRTGPHCRQGIDHGMRENGCKGIRDGKRARTIVFGFQKAYPDSSIRSVCK